VTPSRARIDACVDDDAVLPPWTRLPCDDDADVWSSAPCDDDDPSGLPLHDQLSFPSTLRSPYADAACEELPRERADDGDELPPSRRADADAE
jgi:hypothetical protein